MSFDTKKARLVMADHCMSMADVTRKAGLSNTTLYKIMKGDGRNASIKTIGRIAKALGVPVQDLIAEN